MEQKSIDLTSKLLTACIKEFVAMENAKKAEYDDAEWLNDYDSDGWNKKTKKWRSSEFQKAYFKKHPGTNRSVTVDNDAVQWDKGNRSVNKDVNVENKEVEPQNIENKKQTFQIQKDNLQKNIEKAGPNGMEVFYMKDGNEESVVLTRNEDRAEELGLDSDALDIKNAKKISGISAKNGKRVSLSLNDIVSEDGIPKMKQATQSDWDDLKSSRAEHDQKVNFASQLSNGVCKIGFKDKKGNVKKGNFTTNEKAVKQAGGQMQNAKGDNYVSSTGFTRNGNLATFDIDKKKWNSVSMDSMNMNDGYAFANNRFNNQESYIVKDHIRENFNKVGVKAGEELETNMIEFAKTLEDEDELGKMIETPKGNNDFKRNLSKIKQKFIESMDPSKYESHDAYLDAKKRVVKMDLFDLQTLLLSIMKDEDEEDELDDL